MMSTLTRPPIPRRLVPAPAPPTAPKRLVSGDDEKINGLAACIAAMNTGVNSPNRSAFPRPPRPPPVPPRAESQDALSSDPPPDLSRLLARRPPPPPARRSSSSFTYTPPPSSPIPPTLPLRASVVSRMPSGPPVINTSSKPISVPTRVPTPPPVEELSCTQCRNFESIDAHAALFPRHEVRSLEELAHDLTGPFEADIDKARAIFVWLHYNIAYDTESFFAGNVQPSTPQSTLSSGLAVCEGYAGLFEHIADQIGLQAHLVSGHGKGYGYQPLRHGETVPEMSSNHAWNCVLINQEWHLIDPCWGSGSVSGAGYEPKLATRWFINSPVEFGQRHFPTDPSFQLTPEEVTWEEYILAPEGPTITQDFADLGFHPMLISPPTKHVPERQFTKFSVAKRCEHMSTAEIDNYVLVVSTSSKDFTPMVYSEEEGAWTVTVFAPRSGDITLYIVDTINAEDALGLSVAGYTKAKGRKAMTFKGLAMWSVVHL